MNTLGRSVQCENDKSFSNCTPNKMDYRQKMVVAPQQKLKNEDDDEDDLEALRLAALQSLRTKDAAHTRRQPPTQLQKIVPQYTQTSRPPYKGQRPPRRGYFHNRLQQRQNGNLYYQSPRNPNLIAIVPVDEHSVLQQMQLPCPTKVEKTDACIEVQPIEVSKFNRFKDNGSCSEEEDAKDNNKSGTVTTKDESGERECIAKGVERTSETEDNKESPTESPQKQDEEQDAEEANDDDDDILLMADLEEEDSLERLMDEMEREMNVDKPTEKREKRSSKRESKEGGGKIESTQQRNATANAQEQRLPRADDVGKKDINESATSSAPLTTFSRNERRSVSPHAIGRVNQKRRSLSPKLRSRKKSPRRSPRRSPPIRQPKKSQREMTRYRSPRMSPPRYSPRQRSPLPSRLSPRPRSPLRLSPLPPMRRSPPRGRSPRHSPPPSRISSRSKSPRPPRSRSPRPPRSRSPRFSPITRLTPRRSRSPRSKTPMRGSPCRRSRSPLGQLSPRTNRSKSPPSRRSPPPRRSPPRRSTQSISSPSRRSPSRRSPWSSPRNSPRVSPRRRRSPARWSPKEVSRKHGPPRPRSNSPDVCIHRDSSPLPVKSTRSLSRQENFEEKSVSMTSTVSSATTTVSSSAAITASAVNLNSNESSDVTASSAVGTDPVLEARRRKFESTRPIDPINANKKIKLNKKEELPSKKASGVDGQAEVLLGGTRRTTAATVVGKTDDVYVVEDEDLTMDASSYEYDEDELDEVAEDVTSVPLTTTVDTACVETVEPASVCKPSEKDKSSKKKKKRDKELYQVGKLKSELPLSERIGKDKKCKKRKDVIVTADNPREDVEAIFEDINVDEEGDLRAELSRRRAERLNRTVPIQSARLVQSAFKGVVNEVVKNNAKVNQRHVIKGDEKSNQKDVRRVTVLHRTVSDLHDSEEETPLDSKVPVRFRLGLNKQAQDNREPKAARKTSKRQGRKVKHKSNLSVTDPEQIL